MLKIAAHAKAASSIGTRRARAANTANPPRNTVLAATIARMPTAPNRCPASSAKSVSHAASTRLKIDDSANTTRLGMVIEAIE